MHKFTRYLKNFGPLWLLALPGLAFLIAFLYIPMTGLVIVFKDYNFMDGIYGSPWVGLRNFEFFFYNLEKAWRATRNTLFLNSLYILVGTTASVFLAIFFNEVSHQRYKKFTQSLTILPHFLSWIVIGGILTILTDYNGGLINQIVTTVGLEKIDFNNNPKYWPTILVIVNTWKAAGYSSIIYFAAITGFDTSLYEAAEVDGASITDKVFKITIPMLIPTMVMLTLLSIGRIFYGDLTMMMGLTNLNPMLISTTEIIDSFVYRSVMGSADFSMSSAVGLYQSIFGFILVLLTNHLIGRYDKDYRIF